MSAPIPETLEEALAPAWLGAALGITVESVEAGPVDDRVSTNVPVRVTLADGTRRDVWIKGYFNEYGRLYRHAGVPEASFYRELAAATGIRTLRGVYADADPATGANVVVTADVLREGATFLDSLSDYTPDQTAQSLEQLATLHAATWMRPELAAASWLTPRFASYTENRGVADILVNFDGPIGARVPAAVRDAQRLYDAYRTVAADAAIATPWSVIHGDPHVGNVYLDAEGRPCFCDWQLVQRGPWYLDVGYHLASTLTVDDRRRSEHDLVAHYLGCLTARGVDAPTGDDVWRGLRRGFLHGFYLWGITLKVHPPKTTALLERLGTAVDDHDAYGEVGA